MILASPIALGIFRKVVGHEASDYSIVEISDAPEGSQVIES